ncbi:hypothetical protein [Sporosarcina sp. FA9]|uniref:hypothetical protein n=1 Tax=Sporosarcina sp. FA9 TaxID=3413030 RepID=UPI003F6570EE
MEYVTSFKQAFSKIEKAAQFHTVDKNISGVFYTLYARCKKLIYAINVLRETDEPEVSHVEILPLLRTFLEGYFHLSYVMSEENTEKVKEGYEHLAAHWQSVTAKKMRDSDSLGDLGEDFVRAYSDRKNIPVEYEFLNKPKSLATVTGRLGLWEKDYNILNSFLHFNPSIQHNYGSYIEGKFIFNRKDDTDALNEEATYITVDRMSYLLIAEVTLFLKNDNLEQEVMGLLEDYQTAVNNGRK